MGKAEYKVSGGKLIKVQLTAKENLIEKIKIMGDFFLHPEESIESLEKELENQVLEEQNITSTIKAFLKRHNAILLGVSPEDFARCIIMAGERYG
jgi:hypothetical protein